MDTNHTNFPDKIYLAGLIRAAKEKFERTHSPLEQLAAYSSATMDWIHDYVNDDSVTWELQAMNPDDLWLTWTNPAWNAIIIDRCKRSPKAFREVLNSDRQVAAMFKDAKFVDEPILVRFDKGKYKVLDGMHRVIARIRDGDRHKGITIRAFVAIPHGVPQPKCEAHVVYDLIKAYQRNITTDRASLITALRYLHKTYANVDGLLRNRFNSLWLSDERLPDIIAEVLQD